MPADLVKLTHDFYHFDLSLYGLTHGKDISRRKPDFQPHEDVLSYEFENTHKMRTFTLYRPGTNKKWTEKNADVPETQNIVLTFPGKASRAWYCTPENEAYRYPVPIPFIQEENVVRVQVPSLKVFGAVILAP